MLALYPRVSHSEDRVVPRQFPYRCRVVSLLVGVITLLPRAGSAQGFQGVATNDGLDVVAVGDSGRIWRSLDGGFHWTDGTLGPATATLRDVAMRGNTVVVVGDGGAIRRSIDAGGHWALTTVAGLPALRAVVLVDDSVAYVAGAGGTIVKSIDGGANWSAPLPTGTSATINALAFSDAQHGWAAGAGGTLLETSNGGSSWAPRSVATTRDLRGVDQFGSSVWVVGDEGTARKSANGGANFSPVDLKTRADVRVVRLHAQDAAWLAGGGGFIRHTADGGATWTFQVHPMHAPITDLVFRDTHVWVTNAASRTVLFSTDLGQQWRIPTGAAITHGWGAAPVFSFMGAVIGSTFSINPVDKRVFYCALGNTILRSPDAGETWIPMANYPASFTRSNAFLVSPKDSSVWLAAAIGSTVTGRLLRTTNAGLSWTEVLVAEWGTYGIPLEMDPVHPDTVWFGGEANVNGSPEAPLQRSLDFGATWSAMPMTSFRSPCDLAVMPDSTQIMVVADGVTGTGRGRHWRSTDGGQTFTLVDSIAGSEIPGLAVTRQRPGLILSTCWSNGGVQRSTDFGMTWPKVDNALQSWGIDIARDDPNVIMFGQYSGTGIKTYMSEDGGSSFIPITIPASFGNNYSFLLADRGTMLAEQSSGIWKYRVSYDTTPEPGTQSVTLTAPAGGEVWAAGTAHTIGWTSTNLVLAHLEWQRSPADPWQPIADVPGYGMSYIWTVPLDVTSEARIRISDAWDSDPVSASAAFTITGPAFAASPDTVHLPVAQIGSFVGSTIVVQNQGVTPLDITSVAVSSAEFWVGRSSFVVPPQSSDTLGVFYGPTNSGRDTTSIALAASDSATVHAVVAEGLGVPNVDVSVPGTTAFSLSQNRPNPFSNTTLISYALPADANVRLDVFDLRGQRVATLASGRQRAGEHRVVFQPGDRSAAGAHAMPTGVYFLRLNSSMGTLTRKMLLIE